MALAWVVATCATITAWPAGSTAQSRCRRWHDGGKRVGRLEHAAIDESSGLARSRRHDHVLWTHNDSGGKARLFALDTRDASHRGTVRLEGVEPTDWEDAATGPCPSEDEETSSPCLFIGDIGDNGAKRDTVSVLVVPEPDLPDAPSGSATIERSAISRIPFVYPDGPRDAEVLLAHPSSGRVYVVAKTKTEDNRVYRIPRRPASSKEPRQATSIATLELPHAMAYGRMATAGDIAPSGREVTLRSYLSLFTFCVPEGAPFESAFKREPATVSPPLTVQSEALAYGTDGETLWMTSERRPTPLIRLSPAKESDEDSRPDAANRRSKQPNTHGSTRPSPSLVPGDMMNCSSPPPDEAPVSWPGWFVLVGWGGRRSRDDDPHR